MKSDSVIIRHLHRQDYLTCWQAMQSFTQQRDEDTTDEIWFVEHDPVFTQGQNGKPEHILNPQHIPVIKVDRGGQVTYHGPGQLVIYTLIDLRRKKWTIRELVNQLENAIIGLLNDYAIKAHSKCEAPGVYINNEKICSIGLRIRKGCSFHGLAFNVSMDLTPFTYINPCGYASLKMTQLSALAGPQTLDAVGTQLIHHLMQNLRYTVPILA